MSSIRYSRRTRRAAVAALAVGSLFQFAFLQSCDDRLTALTQFVEPCGTIFGNCNPGDFQVNAADVGDFCVDPSCTIPGQCGSQPILGTITDICP